MKVLIVGIGGLGRYALHAMMNHTIDIQIYTRDTRKYEEYQGTKITCLKNLSDSYQPDIIFITANCYSPRDRYKFLGSVIGTERYIDFRDHELTKNGPMIESIASQLSHLKEIPVIITANPGAGLIRLLHRDLGWKSLYSMMTMLDNERVAQKIGISSEQYVCIGEHGRICPILFHVGVDDKILYKSIKQELATVGKIAYYEHQGVPNREIAQKQLLKIINACITGQKLPCVLETFMEGTDIVLGIPCILSNGYIERVDIPVLSETEANSRERELERISKK